MGDEQVFFPDNSSLFIYLFTYLLTYLFIYLFIYLWLEFKRALPVLYQLKNDLTWSSTKDFCQSKNSDLCSSSDICPKYPFSGRKRSIQWVPVSDGYGMYTGIGKLNFYIKDGSVMCP